MAESMEGIVAEGEQPNTENVEEKTVTGKFIPQQHIRHAYICLPLRLW